MRRQRRRFGLLRIFAAANPKRRRAPLTAALQISFSDAAADFISSLADTELILEAPLAEDYLRSAEILR